MLTYRGYKYRLYPDAEARAYFARCFGATRYCYNLCVRAYDAACSEGRQVSGYDIMALVREQMKDVKWFSGVDCEIKESAPMRFDNALGKYKRHEAERPREHKKGERPCMSYTTGSSAIHVDFKHHLVQLPRIGIVRACLHRTFQGEITSATVKREADGNYYICINVCNDEPAVPLKPHTAEGTVGIDVGLRHLATLSTGQFIDLPDTSRDEARLKFLKERHKKQKAGSRRYNRTAQQIANLDRHLANITKDAHHKAAVMLCRKYDTICMETLNVAGMKRGTLDSRTPTDILFNAKLHHAALALFIDRVKRKAEDTGTNFVQIDRFEPTTKKCHVCGYVLPTIDLDASEWTCPECGTNHDRDVNAAINIRRKGLEELRTKRKKNPNNTLPPAEGKVKPEKKATAGCDLRTGKVTAKVSPKTKTQLNRQPKAQIADGSAPPRIFYREPLPDDHPFGYIGPTRLAKMAGVSATATTKWLEESHFIDPAPKELERTIKLLKAIKQTASDLRMLRMTEDSREHTHTMLGKMNKLIHFEKLMPTTFRDVSFETFRSRRLNVGIISWINDIVIDFSVRLEALADKYLLRILPNPSAWPKPKREVVLCRGKKEKKIITPVDDPQIISYETRIFYIVHIYAIRKECHMVDCTFNKYVGGGTMFRPKNCTRSCMSTFIDGLRNMAGVLSELDTHAESQKERMDQLFDINRNYINLNHLNMTYTTTGSFYVNFTRMGKSAPAYYCEHYQEIMKIITYNIPLLIRECADYLSKVYRI